METRTKAALLAAIALGALCAAPAAWSGDRAASLPYTLRPEWKVESASGAGRAHVSGYLYNTSDTMDASNVLLRIEQLAPDGQVTASQTTRITGDVRSRGRLGFDVPMAQVSPPVRVVVQSVDWVNECR